jgi:hypothetical protein
MLKGKDKFNYKFNNNLSDDFGDRIENCNFSERPSDKFSGFSNGKYHDSIAVDLEHSIIIAS